jgi:hypothetical protein
MTSGSADEMPLWGRLFLWSFVIVFVGVPASIIGLGTIDEIVRPTPEIVSDLPGDDDFTTRLELRFPQGMAESDLVSGLERLGFVPDAAAGRARFSRQSVVCSNDWIVVWALQADRTLATISGYDMGACL